MNPAEKVYSVSELTRKIRNLIEDSLPVLWVEGEISNYKLHSSGHRYFTLKDKDAQLNCVMWRTAKPPVVKMEDGLSIRAYGSVTLWEKGGRYQLVVSSVLPVGVGDLQAAFEALKRKLAEEGLFRIERKRPLPEFPERIGIITSPTGAAIRDLVWGFKKRFRGVELLLAPVAVQGEGSAEQIAAAIEMFNRLKLADVIIIGRGGGSLEDLWSFNEEIVVRAIVGSEIPVVAAIGHEIDVTLSDLAADLRSPTPTAAASLVVKDRVELLKNLNERKRRLSLSLERSIKIWRERVDSFSERYGFKRITHRITEERLRIDDYQKGFTRSLESKFNEASLNLTAIQKRLTALSPNSILNRGYCLARKGELIIRESSQVKPGEEIDLRFSRGSAVVYTLEVHDNG